MSNGIPVKLDYKRRLRYTPASWERLVTLMNEPQAELGSKIQRGVARRERDIIAKLLWAGLIDEDPGLSLWTVKQKFQLLPPAEQGNIAVTISKALRYFNRRWERRKRRNNEKRN